MNDLTTNELTELEIIKEGTRRLKVLLEKYKDIEVTDTTNKELAELSRLTELIINS